jgi:hypothetical protein
MPNDLEVSLIDGGIAPAAAKVLANVISNVATEKTSLGRRLQDATPTKKMRLIDADTRRYVLTNLDQPRREQKGNYRPKTKSHPYSNSQPASADPTITTPSVKAGQFLSVSQQTENRVAQSRVSLNVAKRGGSHARLNPATGQIESVPIFVEVDQKNRLDARVEETSDATVIRLRFLD